MANKVQFGLKNVYFGTYSLTTTGAVTLGTPYKQPGAVKLSLEADTEETNFYADDVKYYTNISDNGLKGELEMAQFTDEFKTQFMNYTAVANGGIAQVKGEPNKTVYVMFEGGGDDKKSRCILYNVELGAITREFATKEGSNEPKTATMSVTVNGDVGREGETGITRVSYLEGTTGYNTLFTAPPVPSTAS